MKSKILLVLAISASSAALYAQSGNVGIGNTTPATKLHVTSTGTGGAGVFNTNLANMALRLENSGNGQSVIQHFLSKDAGGATKEFLQGINPTFNGGNGIFYMGVNGSNTQVMQMDLVTGNVSVGSGPGLSKLNVGNNLSLGATYVSAAAPVNGAIIEGNVGIGNTTPAAKLHVTSTGTGGAGVLNTNIANMALRLENSGNGQSVIQHFLSKDAGGATKEFLLGINPTFNSGNGTFYMGVNGSNVQIMQMDLVTGNVSIGSPGLSKFNVASNLSIGNLYVNNAAPANGAIIEGNVGIGTTTPVAKLAVSGNGGSVTPILSLTNTNVAGNPTLNIYPGYTSGVTTITEGNQFAVVFDQDPGQGTAGANQSLYDFHGQVRYQSASALSDRRLKENISDLKQYGLKEVMQMQPRNYTMKASKTKDIGFIAQELKQIVPELVMGVEAENSLLSVDYSKVCLVLINAIKEQQAQIEALKTANTGLKAEVSKVEQLSNELNTLKASIEKLVPASKQELVSVK